MDCETLRTEVHVAATQPEVQAHLGQCSPCAAYAARFARLDQALRGELIVHAPDRVTERLHKLAIAPVMFSDRVEAALHAELIANVPVALADRLLALVPHDALLAAPNSPLDQIMRESLVVHAPAQLTARLQALVPHAAPMPSVAPLARPRRWVVTSVYAVTMLLLLLSMAMAGQVYSAVIAQLGLQAWLAQLASLPADLLSQLYTWIPQSRVVVGALVSWQQPLQWLLAALVMWAVLDMSQRSTPRHAEQPQPYA